MKSNKRISPTRKIEGVTVESVLIETVANVVTRITILSWAAQPGSLAN